MLFAAVIHLGHYFKEEGRGVGRGAEGKRRNEEGRGGGERGRIPKSSNLSGCLS